MGELSKNKYVQKLEKCNKNNAKLIQSNQKDTITQN